MLREKYKGERKMQTNDVVNELIDLYTGKIMTPHENEVLFRVVKLIRDLEDQSKMYKSLLPTNEGNH
jgi:hypothetical protein